MIKINSLTPEQAENKEKSQAELEIEALADVLINTILMLRRT